MPGVAEKHNLKNIFHFSLIPSKIQDSWALHWSSGATMTIESTENFYPGKKAHRKLNFVAALVILYKLDKGPFIGDQRTKSK